MKRFANKLVAAVLLVAFLVAALVGWQLAACYVANAELQSEMHDLAAQLGTSSGLTPPPSDQELRDKILAKAKEEGIDLDPDQITVERTYTSDSLILHLAVDYDGRADLLFYTFRPHFSLSATGSSPLVNLR
ncbi:MAG TPA: hypothetical protein VMJ93_17715 [Verrucomicrobiae bacterium]|nr:hypothetical protein [Verrucomicrobiae bacterium]